MNWLLQASPSDYDVDSALKAGLVDGTWLAPVHHKDIRVGDTAGIWRCGPNAALVATAEILSLPDRIDPDPAERKYERRPARFAGRQWRVRLRMKPLKVPVARRTFLSDPIARNWKVLHGCQGTVFEIPHDVSAAMAKIVEAKG